MTVYLLSLSITVALGIINVLHNTAILGLSIVNSWFLGIENARILRDSTECVSLDAGSTMVPMIFVLFSSALDGTAIIFCLRQQTTELMTSLLWFTLPL